MRRIKHREFRALAKQCEAQGWTIEWSASDHLKFVSPTGQSVFTSSTPSDYRSVKNFRAQLRRAGADI